MTYCYGYALCQFECYTMANGPKKLSYNLETLKEVVFLTTSVNNYLQL